MHAEYTVPITTTGSAGAAQGSGYTPAINGAIVSIRLAYHASAPATTKVDADEDGGMARKVLNKAASNTSVTHYPRQLMQDTAGVNLTAWYERIVFAGRKLKITVTLSDALTNALVAIVLVKE